MFPVGLRPSSPVKVLGLQVAEDVHFRNYRGRQTSMGRSNTSAVALHGMTVTCPSCRSEGKLGDNPSPAQGVCSRHQEQLLESLPSVSFPEVEFLLVVHPRETLLYEYLQRTLAVVRGVKVIMERRQADRRREPRPVAGDRRRAERRIRQGKALSFGYTLVRFKRR